MSALVPFLIITGAFALMLGPFIWLAARIRRRGTGGGAMSGALAAYEEAFRATSHDAYVEIQAEAERKTPAPSPDNHWGFGRWVRLRRGR
ncbi:hypothetical protein ACIBI4_23930 [Streptomyces sp. NPDC050418]|uniref:hypothetical protein n=1 Tax=Streptomyces sp. NPDC050418 TaxID=3365612 RepID=UPI00378CF090